MQPGDHTSSGTWPTNAGRNINDKLLTDEPASYIVDLVGNRIDLHSGGHVGGNDATTGAWVVGDAL